MAVGAHSRSPVHMIGAQLPRQRGCVRLLSACLGLGLGLGLLGICMSWSSSWRSWGGLWTSAALTLE